MTQFVLDASVTLAWFLDEPVPAFALQVKSALVSGTKAVVPALWQLEMANGLIVAERRRLLTAGEITLALTYLEQLQSHALETNTAPVPFRQAFITAHDFILSAYDAVYLNLARGEGLPLATLDKSLQKAAVRAGIKLLH